MRKSPRRIQRKRTKGWKIPDGAVSVCRPGRWGNPFVVTTRYAAGTTVAGYYIAVPTVEDAVECFRLMMLEKPEFIAEAKAALSGKDLACFCALDQPCHADVLLELANDTTVQP